MMKRFFLSCPVMIFLWMLAACSDNSSDAKSGCSLATTYLPSNPIPWGEEFESGANSSFCTQENFQIPMTGAEVDTFVQELTLRGFAQVPDNLGYYVFQKRDGKSKVKVSFSFDETTSSVSFGSIHKTTASYVNDDIEALAKEELEPLFKGITISPIKWTGTSSTFSASGMTYEGENGKLLEAFADTLARMGLATGTMTLFYEQGVWLVQATLVYSGKSYDFSLRVVAEETSGVIMADWDTAKMRRLTGKITVMLTKLG